MPYRVKWSALGRVDEITDRRFVVIREEAGTMRYVRVQDGEAYQSLSIGDVAELGRAAQERREIAQEIIEQAKANDGITPRPEHLDNLLDRGGDDADIGSGARHGGQSRAFGRVAGRASPAPESPHARAAIMKSMLPTSRTSWASRPTGRRLSALLDVNNVTLTGTGPGLDMGQEL